MSIPFVGRLTVRCLLTPGYPSVRRRRRHATYRTEGLPATMVQWVWLRIQWVWLRIFQWVWLIGESTRANVGEDG